MKRRLSLLATSAGMVAVLAFAPSAAAHNRAHIILPNGECFIVGSEKSATLPSLTPLKAVTQPNEDIFLDLRPGTYPADEIGTAFAADQGNSRLEKGQCPSS